MTPELRSRLQNVTNLPSPPGVAAQVISLSQDPELDLARVVDVVTFDPSLTAKILRVANSPMYAQRRKSDNLRQALVVLGMNATVTLALGFSLLPVLRGGAQDTERYNHMWRRSLLSGVAARSIAARVRIINQEEMFLAALLQDIGILAIDRIYPDFYEACGSDFSDHQKLQAYERASLDCDHAEVGVLLLECWGIPEYLRTVVGASHKVEDSPSNNPARAAERCVALSGLMADLWLNKTDDSESFHRLAAVAHDSLGLSGDDTAMIFEQVGEAIPETAAMFDTTLMDMAEAELIVERAQEALTMLNLQSIREAAKMGAKAQQFKVIAENLEEENQRDNLTRVASRRHLEQLLSKGFAHASRFGWPFSIAFIDLDHFKRINDTYGHQTGDNVLRDTAEMLAAKVRSCDSVGRYGGEEFLLLLPGAAPEGARVVAERILRALREHVHVVDGEKSITVTASIGLASLSGDTEFDTIAEFVHAADKALYAAKAQGRDRAVEYSRQFIEGEVCSA